MITSKLRYGGSQHREHGACYQQSGECEPPIARELYFYSFFLELGQRTEGMRKMINNALGVRSDHLSNRIFYRTRKMKILLTFDNWTKLGLTFISNDLPRWTSARRAPSVRPLQCSRASLKRFALLTLVALWPTSVRLLPSSI